MSKGLQQFIVLAFVTVLLAGCGGYNAVLKSTDNELKYQKALEYRQEGKYDRVLTLLDEISPFYAGTVREDSVLFYTADAMYHSGNFEGSGMMFDDYRRRFGRGVFVEESEYKYAMGLYYISPEPALDQTATMQAIGAINEYMERYPASIKKSICEIRLEELHGKLYDKSLMNARTYYKIGRYKSAVVALKNSLAEYPNTPHREEVMYLITMSSYELASHSVEALQRDRYMDMMDAYYTFVSEYPDSKHRREVDRLQDVAKKYLARHESDVKE